MCLIHTNFINYSIRIKLDIVRSMMDCLLVKRIRKIPGLPIMYVSGYKFTIERMPEAFGAPR